MLILGIFKAVENRVERIWTPEFFSRFSQFRLLPHMFGGAVVAVNGAKRSSSDWKKRSASAIPLSLADPCKIYSLYRHPFGACKYNNLHVWFG